MSSKIGSAVPPKPDEEIVNIKTDFSQLEEAFGGDLDKQLKNLKKNSNIKQTLYEFKVYMDNKDYLQCDFVGWERGHCEEVLKDYPRLKEVMLTVDTVLTDLQDKVINKVLDEDTYRQIEGV